MTSTACETLATLEQALIQRIGEPRFNIWFRPHTRFRLEEDAVHVGVPNRHFQEWLQKTFSSAVRDAAGMVLGRPVEVRFAIDPELFRASRKEQEQPAPPPPATKSAPPLGVDTASTPVRPSTQTTPETRRRWHRLSDFVVGPCNRVAHASALSVVESPGQTANPLVLHGSVGTGKTHLLEGIYAALRQRHPRWRVTFSTAEEFTNRFVQAMRLGKLSAFRRTFRACDALLIDDLDFLASKPATQEEFLHTFDVLNAEGKQLVVTCDVHPRLADSFTPELADRLVGGAVWGLAPPDAETRLAILRTRSLKAEGVPIPDEVLQHLAGCLRGNVRELEGSLASLRHYARVVGRPVDLNLAREALAELLRHAVRVVQLADVDRAVCKVLQLETGSLQSRQRTWAVSHPRMVAVFLARKHTAAAYSEVGQYFGGRNHSTAVAAEKKVRQWLQEDGELLLGERRLPVRDVIDRVERELLR